MKLWLLLLAKIGLALVLTAELTPGYAAEAHMYRCVGANGRVYYSDVLGAECLQGEQDRLTRHGLVLDRAEDEAEEAGKEAAGGDKAQAERKRERIAQDRHDHMLLATYTSEEAIEKAKLGRLKTPTAAHEWSVRKLVIYSNRLSDLIQREAKLTKKNAPVPDVLKADIEVAQSNMARIEKEVQSKQSKIDAIVQRYDEDKKRYRELTVPTRNN